VKHRNHMIPCAIIAVIAMVLLATRGSNPLGASASLALLLCPMVMGTVMWLLMRQTDRSEAHDEHARSELHNDPQPASRIPHP